MCPEILIENNSQYGASVPPRLVSWADKCPPLPTLQIRTECREARREGISERTSQLLKKLRITVLEGKHGSHNVSLCLNKADPLCYTELTEMY